MACHVHLLVMIHGMWGTPHNLSEASKTISKRYESSLLNLDGGPTVHSERTRLDVLVAQTNQTTSTYDGVDWGGERVAEEVSERVEKIEEDGRCKVTSFSVFGYSLGGLLARYLLGILHSRKFFETIMPVNFTTFASPHIGLPRYRSLISTLAAMLGRKLLSRTGEQFYGLDKWGKDGIPLLEVMANKDRIFWRALSLFRHIHIYANSISDITVPFVTAAIELEDPFVAVNTNAIDIKLHPDYGALILSYEKISPLTSSRFSCSAGPNRPLLPVFLKRGFVFETTCLVLSPVVLPAVLSLALLRLRRESRASRSRIKLLEADENNSTRLVYMLDGFESVVEHIIDPIIDPVADAIADRDSLPRDASSLNHASESVPAAKPPFVDQSTAGKRKERRQRASDHQPMLTDAQRRMVRALNELPQMQKHFAFFHPVRNTHGLIVCRDAEEARRVGGEWKAFTEEGEGVLRHWADGFVL